jgi:hypothetical protein
VEANHHFLIPRDGSTFRFSEGRYRMDVFAKLLGDRRQTLLCSQNLDIPRETSVLLENPEAGLYFDWGPDSSRYLLYVDQRPTLPDPGSFLKLFGLAQREARPEKESQQDVAEQAPNESDR